MNYSNLGLRESDWVQITYTITSFPEVTSIKVFGSRAKGTFRNGSDIDIALIGDAITPKIINKISFQLNEETTIPFFVDIVDYTHLDKLELKNHIDQFGLEDYSFTEKV